MKLAISECGCENCGGQCDFYKPMKKELTCNHSETRVCVNCWQPTGISGVSEKDTEKMIETNELSRPTSQEKSGWEDRFRKQFEIGQDQSPTRLTTPSWQEWFEIINFIRAAIASERSSIARELTEKIKDLEKRQEGSTVRVNIDEVLAIIHSTLTTK